MAPADTAEALMDGGDAAVETTGMETTGVEPAAMEPLMESPMETTAMETAAVPSAFASVGEIWLTEDSGAQ